MPLRPRTRTRLLALAGLCLLVLATLAVLVKVGWAPLQEFDTDLGTEPQAWTLSTPLATRFWLFVGEATGAVAMTVYTAIAAVGLFLMRYRRAAYFTVAVMGMTALCTYLLKIYFERSRPLWEEPIQELSTFSFPSGHSSSIAAAMGVATVLTVVLVRRRGVRRGLITLWVFLTVLVGLDRIFLGLHNVSDVVAGWALGLFWVLVAMVVFHPAPRGSRRSDVLTSSLPSTKKLAVVLNPIKVEDTAAFKAMVELMAEECGWSRPDWYETTIEDAGKSMAEQAAISGADLVLVCGGDGTVRTVCAELAGTGVSVGVVPAGTGNLLARNLGIPLYLQAAIDVALNGQDRAIDLVALSGDGLEEQHFLVMAGMGFDAAIMEGASDDIKAKIGWLAYFVSGFRHLRYPALKVEISLDGAPATSHRVRTVVIGNVGYLTAGIPLLPDATIDDGVLDVVLVSPRRFVSWVPLVWRVMSKGKRTDEALDRMTGRKVSIRAAHDTPRQVDGDPVGAGKELHAECIHGRLLVRVPR